MNTNFFIGINEAFRNSPMQNKFLMESTYSDALKALSNTMLDSLTVIIIGLLCMTIIKQIYLTVIKQFIKTNSTTYGEAKKEYQAEAERLDSICLNCPYNSLSHLGEQLGKPTKAS